MSSWVENQRQEAFQLYRRYLGITLHFKQGAGYDYTLYNGATKASMSAFLKKPPAEVAKFIQLSNRLKGINQEEFLFANARYGLLDVRDLMGPKSLQMYNSWKDMFGDEESFVGNVYDRFQAYSKLHPMSDIHPARLVLDLLGGDDDLIELAAWLLQKNPEITTQVRAEAEKNILQKLALDRVIKIQKFYSYFMIM